MGTPLLEEESRDLRCSMTSSTVVFVRRSEREKADVTYVSCLRERISLEAERYDAAALEVSVRLAEVSLVVVGIGRR